MAELQGQIIPESEAEYALLRALYEATGEAQRDGVDTSDIVASLNFVAASIQAFDDAESLPDEPAEPTETKREDCPVCGEAIQSVAVSIGGGARIDPCGCEVDAEAVEGWVENV